MYQEISMRFRQWVDESAASADDTLVGVLKKASLIAFARSFGESSWTS